MATDNQNQYIASAFPPHNVDPKEKASKKWGLQGVKAIWFFNHANAPVLFYNDRESYVTFLKYAFGEQDDVARPALGINPKNGNQEFLSGIRWGIKNFATKRVQATVSRVFSRKYDPIATAIDPTSSDRREAFKASLKTWSEQQQWLAERQQMIGIDMAPDGVDMDNLPTNDEDLEIFMQNYKLSNEINLELGIKWHLNRLDFDSAIKEKFDQYLTILPAAAVWVGMDANGLPIVKALNPGRILAPRSEYNDYKRIAYGAYVDEYTISEFKVMCGNEFTPNEITDIAKRYAKKGNYQYTSYNTNYPYIDKDVDTIQIVHFEISTVDEYVFLEKKDKYGNSRLQSKPFDYYRTNSEDFRTKYKTERSIHRVPKKTTYGGYWIVGSDILFGYGEKNNLKGDIGYKLRASNSLSGHTTCLMKQMKPCLDNLETYDKKIQQLVASSIPKAIKIDLFALRKAAFKFNGKDMETQDLLEMFFQTGVIVVDTSDLGSGVGDARKAIEIMDAGMSKDLVNYMNLMRSELEQLDEIIGYNRVSSGASLSPETGNGVAQQMNDATDVNLDHIFRADRGLCKEVYESLGHLHRQSVMLNPDYYVQIFGEEAVSRILTSMPFDDIGIDIEARPTAAEWNNFYLELEGLVKNGQIDPEDRVAIRRFQSLKQAEAYLQVVTRRRKKEKLQEQVMLINKNAEAQQASNQQVAINANDLEDKRVQNERDLLALQAENKKMEHKYKMEELALQASLLNQGKVAVEQISSATDIKVASMKPAPSAS